MNLPFDIWYVILPHTNLKTLLICRCLCKKVLKITNNVMKTSRNDINWNVISGGKTLSEDFIREFQEKVYWYWISQFQKLSEDFIREFQDKVNWYKISIYQTLSEDFIHEFQDKVHWFWICNCQKLSEDFIRKFDSGRNKVDWRGISSQRMDYQR